MVRDVFGKLEKIESQVYTVTPPDTTFDVKDMTPVRLCPGSTGTRVE